MDSFEKAYRKVIMEQSVIPDRENSDYSEWDVIKTLFDYTDYDAPINDDEDYDPDSEPETYGTAWESMPGYYGCLIDIEDNGFPCLVFYYDVKTKQVKNVGLDDSDMNDSWDDFASGRAFDLSDFLDFIVSPEMKKALAEYLEDRNLSASRAEEDMKTLQKFANELKAKLQ